MADLQNDQGGRTAEFDGGRYGGGTTHLATSMQQNVPAEFSPSSVLMLPNLVRPVNAMSEGTYNRVLPMEAMIRRQTGMTGSANA